MTKYRTSLSFIWDFMIRNGYKEEADKLNALVVTMCLESFNIETKVNLEREEYIIRLEAKIDGFTRWLQIMIMYDDNDIEFLSPNKIKMIRSLVGFRAFYTYELLAPSIDTLRYNFKSISETVDKFIEEVSEIQ